MGKECLLKRVRAPQAVCGTRLMSILKMELPSGRLQLGWSARALSTLDLLEPRFPKIDFFNDSLSPTEHGEGEHYCSDL